VTLQQDGDFPERSVCYIIYGMNRSTYLFCHILYDLRCL